MSTNALNVTVVGWAASTPRDVVGDGVPFTSFRVATTPRRYDNRQAGWIDGRTEWITVKVFRDVAFNVATSIIKGQPVIVTGRLHTEDWVSDNGPRTNLVIEAVALGHDLTRGTAKFARTVYAGGANGAKDEAAGSDRSDDAAGPGLSGIVDPWARDARPDDQEPLDGPRDVDGAGEVDPADEEVALVTS